MATKTYEQRLAERNAKKEQMLEEKYQRKLMDIQAGAQRSVDGYAFKSCKDTIVDELKNGRLSLEDDNLQDKVATIIKELTDGTNAYVNVEECLYSAKKECSRSYFIKIVKEDSYNLDNIGNVNFSNLSSFLGIPIEELKKTYHEVLIEAGTELFSVELEKYDISKTSKDFINLYTRFTKSYGLDENVISSEIKNRQKTLLKQVIKDAIQTASNADDVIQKEAERLGIDANILDVIFSGQYPFSDSGDTRSLWV